MTQAPPPHRSNPRRFPGRLALIVWSAIAMALIGAGCAVPEPAAVPRQLITRAGPATPTWFSSTDMHRSLPINRGIAQSVVDRGGAAWDPSSALLGQVGTTILFGHRVSHGGPFRTIPQLHTGSRIRLKGSDGHVYVYSVVRTEITQPTWDAVLDFHPDNGKGLTLVACHPLGSSALRFVVNADLVGVT
jgi:LPXTG-site transpeptidase (sortase) family protein